MIVDCHIHLNNYHEGHPHPTTENLTRLRSRMDKYGVGHAVVITSYMVNADRPSVQHVIEQVRGDERISVVEGMDIDTLDARFLQGLEERLASGAVKGIKLYPGYQPYYPSDRLLHPVYEMAAKYRAPVMIHTGDTYTSKGKLKYSHPLNVDEVAVDWRGVNFIICHLGTPWLTDTAELMYKNENVYADISGLVLGEVPTRLEHYIAEKVKDVLLYLAEPDELLYGTDWPLVRMGPYLEFVKKLDMEPKHRELLMWKNASALFRINEDVLRAAHKSLDEAARAAAAPHEDEGHYVDTD